jgi:hypothetical protein
MEIYWGAPKPLNYLVCKASAKALSGLPNGTQMLSFTLIT